MGLIFFSSKLPWFATGKSPPTQPAGMRNMIKKGKRRGLGSTHTSPHKQAEYLQFTKLWNFNIRINSTH